MIQTAALNVPAAGHQGAQFDCSAFDRRRSITFSGSLGESAFIEGSADGAQWVSLARVSIESDIENIGHVEIDVPAKFMRINRLSAGNAAALVVNVTAGEDGTAGATGPTGPGNAIGPAQDGPVAGAFDLTAFAAAFSVNNNVHFVLPPVAGVPNGRIFFLHIEATGNTLAGFAAETIMDRTGVLAQPYALVTQNLYMIQKTAPSTWRVTQLAVA